MPTNFYIIIFIQFFVYLHFAWKYEHRFLNKKDLVLSALFGIIFGFLLDITASSLHLYTYIRDSILNPARPWNLTLLELIINGALSYGLATATTKTLLTKSVPIEGKKRLKPALLFLLLIVVTTYAMFQVVSGTILMMFLLGTWIVSCGELLLLAKRTMGPVTELITLRNVSTSVSLWWRITLVAIFYELTNMLFPFWSWLPGSLVPQSAIEIIIIVAGYYALLHPSIVFWRLREHRQ
jgi:hypothetical protein